MSGDEKKTASKLLRLAPALMARLNRAAAARDEDATEICVRGLVRELEICEAEMSGEVLRAEKLRQLAARGVDDDALLDRELRDRTEPELPLAQEPRVA